MLPTKPLNTDYLHNYSRDLALQLSNKFFANADTITGEQIIEFSSIKQINFLILKILEERWEAEVARLESPFFDYSHTDVQEGLRSFLNILSQHIRVSRKTFTTVLMEAIFGTLQLILDPRSFYEQEIQKAAKLKLTAEYYRRTIKYLQYNREIFKTFVGELSLRYPQSFEAQEAMSLWQNTLRDHWRYIEPTEWRVKAFNNLMVLDLDDIYTHATEIISVNTQEPVLEIEGAEIKNNLPTIEVEKEEVVAIIEPILPTIEVEKEEVVAIIEPILPAIEVEKEEVVAIIEPILPTVEVEKEEVVAIIEPILPAIEVEKEEIVAIIEPILPTIEVEKEEIVAIIEPILPTIEVEKDDTASYFEQIGDNNQDKVEPTVAQPKETIVIQYRQDKISSLLEAIPLHEKFTFIDELFGGDNLAFQDALEKIDKSPNYEEARRLTNQYILQHNWDFDQDSTQEFLSWLGRRF